MSTLDQLFLSRRNLLTLLSKLDRVKQGEHSECMLIKFDNTHPAYPQSMRGCQVKAMEDTEWNPGNTSDKVYLHRKDLEELLTLLQEREQHNGKIPSIIRKCGVWGGILIIAVSDVEYYKDRLPGEVYYKDFN